MRSSKSPHVVYISDIEAEAGLSNDGRASFQNEGIWSYLCSVKCLISSKWYYQMPKEDYGNLLEHLKMDNYSAQQIFILNERRKSE